MQLSEVRQCGVNEIVKASKRHQDDSNPDSAPHILQQPAVNIDRNHNRYFLVSASAVHFNP